MKKIIVLGSGESGLGAAILAHKNGDQVFVSDHGTIPQNTITTLDNLQIEWEQNGHNFEQLKKADLVVKSPGISDFSEVVQYLNTLKIELISEIEYAYRYTNAKIIAITGSNGKTTTAMLTYHLLKSAGIHVCLAGNIGNSFAREVARENYEVFVLEVSSFQLDGISTFRPDIAIITNITPDHLDRYQNDFNLYKDSKFRIAQNQTNQDYLIIDGDDPNISSLSHLKAIKSQIIQFTLEKSDKSHLYITDNQIISKIEKEHFKIPLSQMNLTGKHNKKNAMAASAASQLMKIRKQTIRESLLGFQGVEHRLEFVAKKNGVQFINDSKATNVNASFYALDSVKTPTIWIAGGVDKGNDYDELMAVVREKVKTIICLGIDNEKLIHAYKDVVDHIYEANSMDQAIEIAVNLSEDQDTVLLSPACASFDRFENFQDRGRQFKNAVQAL